MANLIHILPEYIANQIAAGEVIQRPSSIVKELLENAIDAKATHIELFIKEAGRSIIHIIDNGEGMSPLDAKLSFKRHATSKIKKLDDLFQIQTKGFRGEALASITAIAEVDIRTKEKEAELGIELSIAAGEIKKEKAINMAKGTQIIVKNLFFNVPVRRNFLKPNKIEFRYILDEFDRVALAHPDINFELYHNKELIIQLKKSSLRQRIIGVFGQKINEQLVPVSEKTNWVQIEGFIAKPAYSKKYRKEQFFFINNRYVKNPYLYKAILDAFEGLLKPSYHPSFFIFISLDPKDIDINIHPTKTEVKFQEDLSLFNLLRASIKHALGQYQVIPVLDFDRDQYWDIPLSSKKKGFISPPKIHVNPNYNPFLEETYNKKAEKKISRMDLYEQIKEDPTLIIENASRKEQEHQDLFNERQQTLSFGLGCLQIHNKYILTSIHSGLILINQNKAHIRILYESFLKEGKPIKKESQILLFPIKINLSKKDIEAIKLMYLDLEELGFEIVFYKEHIRFKSTPSYIKADKIESFIENLIEELDLTKQERENKQKENIAYCLARTNAVKLNVALTLSEVEHIAHGLFACKEPNYTPKGHPTFITLSNDFIEKQFYK